MKLRIALIIQGLLLLATVVLGASQVTNPATSLLMLHKLLGVASGGVSLISVYLAYKQPASARTRYLCIAIVLLTILGGIGGKVGESSFDLGVLLMRIAGFGGLALVIITLIASRKVAAKA